VWCLLGLGTDTGRLKRPHSRGYGRVGRIPNVLRFTLIIPLQDEERSVGALLESILQQSRPPDELVLVDAGSLDRTGEMIRELQAPFPVKVVRAPRVYPGLARNLGVTQSSHEWLAFTDGGITLASNWLEELTRAAAAGVDVQAVFGRYDPVCDTFFKECSAIAYVPPIDVHGIRGVSVVSFAIRKAIFNALDGFPPFRASEDLIFLEKVLERGNVSYAPQALARWEMPATVRRTFDRFAEYSFHNLAAKRAAYWHAGLLRLYLLLGALAVALVVAGEGLRVFALLPLFFLTRAGKSAWLKRFSLPFSSLTPTRLLGAALVLVLTDASTVAGALRWAARPKPGGETAGRW
jgi:glycosyltransferase involved in cell wall biosynthesis